MYWQSTPPHGDVDGGFSQISPVKPDSQVHVKPESASSQEPPLRQGFGLQPIRMTNIFGIYLFKRNIMKLRRLQESIKATQEFK